MSTKRIPKKAKTPDLSVFAVIGADANDASLQQEIEVCKSALLYADKVTVASPRLFAVVDNIALSNVTAATFSQVIGHVYRDGGDTLKATAGTMQKLVQILDSYPPRWALSPEQRKHKRMTMQDFDRGLESLRTTARRNLAEAGFGELAPAIKAGVLKLDPLVREGDEFEELTTNVLVERYVEAIHQALADGNTYPLFDDGTGRLVRHGIEAGLFVRTDTGRSRRANVAVGTGLIDRLPNFPLANMSEVLDIRTELAVPLGRFRRAVRDLAKDIGLAPENPEFGEALNDRWNCEVRPALDEIEERTRQDASLRALTGRLAAKVVDIKSIPAAALLGGSLVVAAGAKGWVGATAAAAVQLGIAPLSEIREHISARREVARAQYYFLYRANRDMG